MEWRGRPAVLWLLMGLLGYLGIRALLGGGQFIVAPSGAIVGLSPAVLSGTPFRDFLLPGLFLFVGLGVFPLVVLYGVYRSYQWAPAGALVVGVVLGVWAVVEGFVLGFGERLQYVNLVQAIVIVVLAGSRAVRDHVR